MSVRPVSFAALAAAVLVLPGRPDRPAHPGAAPTVARYRFAQQIEQDVDLSAMGGGKQTTRFGTSLFVTLTLADSAGGRTAHVVFDSVTVDSGAQLPAQVRAQMDSLKGATYHAWLNRGKVATVKAVDDTTASITQARGLLNALFLPTKSSAKAGDTWADTTNVTNDIPAGTMTVRTVTSYKATGSAAGAGAKGLKVDATTSTSFSGTQGGAPIEGTGNGSGSYVVGADGRVLSGTERSTSNLTVAPSQAPEPIQVLIRQSTTITSLP
ncbi:MAG TPA: hypothetical protein VFS40_01110 [Gemmatimonadales bacterium]|nr:hypothetical protein [Gemmatimonadales bacterium]